MRRIHPGASAVLKVGILLLPAIPALIWLWPAVSGTTLYYPAQVLAYLYVLAGSLLMGRRCLSWAELGLSRRGIGMGLTCGAVLIAERVLAQLALGLPLALRPFDADRLAGELVFILGLVGPVEELLFRGWLFQALDSWRGPGLAVLGSSLGFAIWHVGWAGSLMVIHLLLGLVLGLIRWRAGGIVGLIVVHGLFDLLAAETLTPVSVTTLGQLTQITVINRPAVLAGDLLLLALILYLWKVHPAISRPRP